MSRTSKKYSEIFPPELEDLILGYVNPCESLPDLRKRCLQGSPFPIVTPLGKRKMVNCPTNCLNICEEWMGDLIDILAHSIPALYDQKNDEYYFLPSMSLSEEFVGEIPEFILVDDQKIPFLVEEEKVYPRIYRDYYIQVKIVPRYFSPGENRMILTNESKVNIRKGCLINVRNNFISSDRRDESKNLSMLLCEIARDYSEHEEPLTILISMYTEGQRIPLVWLKKKNLELRFYRPDTNEYLSIGSFKISPKKQGNISAECYIRFENNFEEGLIEA